MALSLYEEPSCLPDTSKPTRFGTRCWSLHFSLASYGSSCSRPRSHFGSTRAPSSKPMSSWTFRNTWRCSGVRWTFARKVPITNFCAGRSLDSTGRLPSWRRACTTPPICRPCTLCCCTPCREDWISCTHNFVPAALINEPPCLARTLDLKAHGSGVIPQNVLN